MVEWAILPTTKKTQRRDEDGKLNFLASAPAKQQHTKAKNYVGATTKKKLLITRHKRRKLFFFSLSCSPLLHSPGRKTMTTTRNWTFLKFLFSDTIFRPCSSVGFLHFPLTPYRAVRYNVQICGKNENTEISLVNIIREQQQKRSIWVDVQCNFIIFSMCAQRINSLSSPERAQMELQAHQQREEMQRRERAGEMLAKQTQKILWRASLYPIFI